MNTHLPGFPKPRMARFLLLTLMLITLAPVILSLGCLGTLQRSEDAEEIAVAAAPALHIPLRQTHPHWFLRQEAGWLGAHRARFGGEGEDEGFAFVRVAIFTDPAAAGAALARLTPEYMGMLWHERMAAPPQPVTFPVRIAGDEVTITEYPLHRSPGDDNVEEELIVQLIALRAGRAVVVIESIGVPREGLGPVADRLVNAVRAREALVR